jgi:hypothetical protein
VNLPFPENTIWHRNQIHHIPALSICIIKLTAYSFLPFRSGTHDVQFETIPRNGVFDAVASVIVNDSNPEDSTNVECELKIPETNYTIKKVVTLTIGKY